MTERKPASQSLVIQVGRDFKYHSTKKASINLWGIHGYGGGGPVTKDMIQRARMQQYVDNADIICSGHTHDFFVTEDVKVHLNNSGRVEQKIVTTVKLPSYKDEYKSGRGGFHVETGKPPKPIGAAWLRFYIDGSKIRYEIRKAT